jgi:hypothetical protein
MQKMEEVNRMMIYQEKLVEILLGKNQQLNELQARTWVELLWEDFEATYAKAGREYKGPEMTERIVRQWIENYGEKLHEFETNNPKYSHLLKNNLIQ